MSLKLTELLHHIKTEKKDGLVNIDDWRFPDVGHLIDMGFDFDDDYHLSTTREPKITIYQKKEVDETSSKNKKVPVFYVEEEGKTIKKFGAFNDVIDYFDKYEQPIIDDKN